MIIKALELSDYRNYESLNISFDKGTNILYGDNAQGKTNLLEAIYYGSFGLSHRTSTEEELLKWNCSEMAVGVDYESFTGNHAIKIKRFKQLEKIKKQIF